MSDQTITRVAVDIYGTTYKMAGYEPAGHMRLVATMVDDKMREIQSANPSLDTAKLAVLTAVNTMHDYLKVKEQLEELEQQLKQLKGGLND